MQLGLEQLNIKNNKNPTILVTGMMGSGKTTYATKLNNMLNFELLSFDSLKSTEGHKYPGTEEALYAINNTTVPTVAEGVQVMGFPMSLIKNCTLIILEVPRGEIVKRLRKRGLINEKGEPIHNDKKALDAQLDKVYVYFDKFKKALNKANIQYLTLSH